MSPEMQRVIAWSTRVGSVLLVLLLGVAGYIGLVQTAPRIQEDDTPRTLPSVAVFRPVATPVRRQWRGFGTARPYQAADVPARVGSLVLRISPHIRAGVRVTAGETLLLLDPSDFERQEEAARYRIEEMDAQLDALDVELQRLETRLAIEQEDVQLAEIDLERSRTLFEQNVETQQQVNIARREMLAAKRALFVTEETLAQLPLRRKRLEANRRTLEAERAQAELNLRRCTIVSPIAGVLQALDVDEGENVSAGQRVARVVDLRRVEVPLRLPVSARRFVSLGDDLRIESTGAIPRAWDARVVRIAPEDDPEARTMTVFAEVDQEPVSLEFGSREGQQLLFPGSFVSGILSGEPSEPRWVVPRGALREGRIQFVENGTLRSRPVQVDFTIQQELPALGLDDDQWVVLLDDLSSLDQVLTAASPVLRDGQSVEVIDVQVVSTARHVPPSSVKKEKDSGSSDSVETLP